MISFEIGLWENAHFDTFFSLNWVFFQGNHVLSDKFLHFTGFAVYFCKKKQTCLLNQLRKGSCTLILKLAEVKTVLKYSTKLSTFFKNGLKKPPKIGSKKGPQKWCQSHVSKVQITLQNIAWHLYNFNFRMIWDWNHTTAPKSWVKRNVPSYSTKLSLKFLGHF